MDVVIWRTVLGGNKEQQQKKLIYPMIPGINVLNAVLNLKGISTFVMILVTVLLEIAMICTTKSTMAKQLVHNNNNNDNKSPELCNY